MGNEPLNHETIELLSHDVDDFISKMVSVHGINFSMVVASMFARLSVISMKTKQEVFMLRLMNSMQETLLNSLVISEQND